MIHSNIGQASPPMSRHLGANGTLNFQAKHFLLIDRRLVIAIAYCSCGASRQTQRKEPNVAVWLVAALLSYFLNGRLNGSRGIDFRNEMKRILSQSGKQSKGDRITKGMKEKY